MLQWMHIHFSMEENEVRKKAPRKVVRKTTKVVSAKAPAPKRVASVRKAPVRNTQTPVVSEKKQAAPKSQFIATAICFVIIGGAIAVGYSDTGSIDVTHVISERKQNASPQEQELFKTIPVQQGQSNVPNGGLVGSGKSAPVPPPVTATSSDATASSSDASATSSPQQEGEEAVSEEETAAATDTTSSSTDETTPEAQ